MTAATLIARQVRYEQKSYWRNPAAALLTFAFPLVFFFIFNSIFGHNPLGQLGGTKAVQYYTPSILGFAVMSTCFVSIALGLVQRRESGLLKRLRGTPLPPWAFIGGILGNALINTALLTVITLAFATFVYGASIPASHLPSIVVTTLIAALAFCALGVAISSAVPNVDSGPAVLNLPYTALVFISGGFFPVSGALGRIASVLPLRPFILALYRAFDPRVHGSAWAPGHIRQLLIWGVIATIVAARRFRWLPRRH